MIIVAPNDELQLPMRRVSVPSGAIPGITPRGEPRRPRGKSWQSASLPSLTELSAAMVRENSSAGAPRLMLGTRGSLAPKHLGMTRKGDEAADGAPEESPRSPAPTSLAPSSVAPNSPKQGLPSIKSRFAGPAPSKEHSIGRFLLDNDDGTPMGASGGDDLDMGGGKRSHDIFRDPTEEGVMLRKAVRMGLCKGQEDNHGHGFDGPMVRRGKSMPGHGSTSPPPWEVHSQAVALSASLSASAAATAGGAAGAGRKAAAVPDPIAGPNGLAILASPPQKANTGPMHSLGISFRMLKKMAVAVDAKLSTADVVKQLILPATSPTRCRYLDLMTDKHLGQPNYYVIHAWAANFRQLVASLDLFLTDNRANLDESFVWLDILCNNLHIIQTKENMARCKEILERADKVLFYLDSEGICFGRAWVQFELWQVVSRARGGDKLSILHNPVWDWEQLAHMYASMNIYEASCHLQADRNVLMSDMSRTIDMSLFSHTLRRQLQFISTQDLQRTEKLASVNPKPHINTAMSRAVFLVMERHLKDAEDTLKRLLVICNKARNEMRDVADKDIINIIIALAKVQRLLGKTSDAENVLQGLVVTFRGMKDEIYYEGMGMLAAVMMTRRQFTKAEMLCRRIMQEREAGGTDAGKLVGTLLQMADIALAQKLNDEADEYLRDALHACQHLEADHPDVGRVKHKLAVVATGNVHDDRAIVAVEDALTTRTDMLGWDHPETLETRLLEADYLARKAMIEPDCERGDLLQDVIDRLQGIHKARTRTFGTDHPTSLEVWGRLSDVYYELGFQKEGLDMEKKILEVGRVLLKHTHAEKFNSLIWISRFLAKRDHLLTSAALFLARAYQVYKDKLGVDHEVTLQTRAQLSELAVTIKEEAAATYREAENSATASREQRLFSQAELMYKQALQVSKLINPVETEHKEIARGLADSLFGQGKMHEGKRVMSTHGLASFQGGRTPMPASYVRWFNKRVNNFLQKQADDAESKEGMYGTSKPEKGDGFEGADIYESSDDEEFI